MISHRFIHRAGEHLARRSQPLALRSAVRRRLASTEAPKFKEAQDNAFNRERAAVKAHAAGSTDLWRKISIYVVVPCLLAASINAYNLWSAHWKHWDHMPPLEERTEYSYQNIRTKNFPFGNGDETLFWNPEVNYHNKDK